MDRVQTTNDSAGALMRCGLVRIVLCVAALVATGCSAAAADGKLAGGVPIAIKLDAPQYATVVIEDAAGRRVRNLLGETQLPAGTSTIFWDCYDDGEMKDDVLVRRRVAPGAYRVRGLSHDGLKTYFEFPIYSGGNPPWSTKEETGGWLADHSSPLGATFIPRGSPYGEGKPQVLLTALVAETGRPTVWVGTDGATYKRKALWGWEGGQSAATDFGPNADQRYYAYVLLSFGRDGDLILKALPTDGTAGTAIRYRPKVEMPKEPREIGLALAVHDGLAVATLPLDDAIVFFDIKSAKVLGTASVKAPKGVLIDAKGRLLVSTEGTVKRFTLVRDSLDSAPTLRGGQVLISGLEDPRTIQTDLDGGELYVADWGNSHQVKVFSADGKPARVIGKAGGFQVGRYDELRMHRPQGLAIDDRGQLWVAEADWLPKRISMWRASDGSFIRGIYGPPHYGGGGTIDPTDKTRCFYGEYGGTLEFKLDWEKGTSTLVAVPLRTIDVPARFDPMPLDGFGAYGPEVPWHVNGRLYLTLGFQSGLRVNDTSAIYLYDEKTMTIRPVAHVGSMRHWDFIRKGPFIKELQEAGGTFEPLLCWTDLNADGKATKDEFAVRRFEQTYPKGDGSQAALHGFRSWMPSADLSMSGSWSVHLPAPRFRADGTPLYDLQKARFMIPPSKGENWNEDGHAGLRLDDGSWLMGLNGWKNGERVWSYPATWEHGLPPQYPGHVVEPTRMMGPPFTPAGSEARNIFCVNGERGNMYLFSGDGLLIQTIGGHRMADPLMHFPIAKRGMDVSGYSFEDEHFHPTITCTRDGEVYMVAGKEHSSVFRIDGFRTIRLRDFGTLRLANADLSGLPATVSVPNRKQGRMKLDVIVASAAPTIDGVLEGAWDQAHWVDVGSAGRGTLMVRGDRMFVAWKTSDPDMLANSATTPAYAFTRGGSVDLMVGPARRDANEVAAGDQRLLIYETNGKMVAVLYRQLSTRPRLGQGETYTSPIGEVKFDDVAVVTSDVMVARAGGIVEASIPLALLGISGQVGEELHGDIGILRGDGSRVVQRSYWNNLDTAMVSDIPSEARLVPARWGEFKIVEKHEPAK